MNSWVARIILANIVLFVLTSIRPVLVQALAFAPVYVLERRWTIVTYMFVHGSFSHILFNMLALFFFGPRVEGHLGAAHFLGLYFVSGSMGAMLSFISPFTWIIGASGAVYGITLAFAYYWPREQIYVWGILPIEARWMVVIMTALSMYGGFGGGGDSIAHYAHLGGFAGGYLYLKIMEHNARGSRYLRQITPAPPSGSDIARWRGINRTGMHEINQAELDRILDKISKTGLPSLTAEERSFLERFSSRTS